MVDTDVQPIKPSKLIDLLLPRDKNRRTIAQDSVEKRNLTSPTHPEDSFMFESDPSLNTPPMVTLATPESQVDTLSALNNEHTYCSPVKHTEPPSLPFTLTNHRPCDKEGAAAGVTQLTQELFSDNQVDYEVSSDHHGDPKEGVTESTLVVQEADQPSESVIHDSYAPMTNGDMHGGIDASTKTTETADTHGNQAPVTNGDSTNIHGNQAPMTNGAITGIHGNNPLTKGETGDIHSNGVLTKNSDIAASHGNDTSKMNGYDTGIHGNDTPMTNGETAGIHGNDAPKTNGGEMAGIHGNDAPMTNGETADVFNIDNSDDVPMLNEEASVSVEPISTPGPSSEDSAAETQNSGMIACKKFMEILPGLKVELENHYHGYQYHNHSSLKYHYHG